jgi:hypothetical protein
MLGLISNPENGGEHAHLKRRWSYNGPHGIVPQQTQVFIYTYTTTSNAAILRFSDLCIRRAVQSHVTTSPRQLVGSVGRMVSQVAVCRKHGNGKNWIQQLCLKVLRDLPGTIYKCSY